MQPVQTVGQNIGKKVQRQAETLKTQGVEAVSKVQETAQVGGRKLTERLERLRQSVAWDKLTPENLKAAAEDAAHAFADHFRAAPAATTPAETASTEAVAPEAPPSAPDTEKSPPTVN